MQLALSIIIGIGLAASAGFRIFVPLLAMNLASKYGLFSLQESWAWMGSDTALVIFAIATIMEALAYMVPWLDNILDTIATPAAAVAGTLIVVATIGDMDPVLSWTLAIIAGGGTAATLKGTSSGVRVASTATTVGVANPVIAIFETIMSSLLSILSLFAPIIAIIMVFLLFFMVRKLYKKVFRKKTSSAQ